MNASPTQLAVIDSEKRINYAQLDVMVARLAGHLSAAGIQAGERVAIMLENSLDAILTVLALARMGAVTVPIGERLRRPEIAHIFADATPVAIVYNRRFQAEIPPEGPGSDLRFETSDARWARLLATDAPVAARAPQISETDVFGILYTSGTTGKPKGAILTHLNVIHSCMHWRDVFELRSGERALLCVPWSHVAGLCGILLPFLGASGTLVVMTEFKRRPFLELAHRERITYALMVPAMYGLCLLEPDLSDFDLATWRIAAYGSAPMPEPTIRRFAQIFPHLQMVNCYGATETTSPATLMPLGCGTTHSASIGRVVPCGDIRVMSESGIELAAGEEGELWIGGPMVIPGYWGNPQATAEAFAGGYWKSGDIGAIDAQGFVRIADRKKDMINRGGFKIYPAEVESVLTGLPGVVEAAVIGEPDPILGERVLAFVSATDGGVTVEEVAAWCAQRLADYKVPGRIEISREALPRNANGKIQKTELRQRVSPGRARDSST